MEIRLRKARICKELEAAKAWDIRVEVFDVRAPEEKMTFGGDQNCSASHFRQFIEHYKLIRMVNMRKRLTNWDDPSYRAAKLRIALNGAPAEFIEEKSSMLKDWTENDNEIMRRLKERYIDTESIELRIMEAEEVSQQKDEAVDGVPIQGKARIPKRAREHRLQKIGMEILVGDIE